MTIDKNNIFLGATVKNDDAKVIISRIVAGGAVQIDGRLREGMICSIFSFNREIEILSKISKILLVLEKIYFSKMLQFKQSDKLS